MANSDVKIEELKQSVQKAKNYVLSISRAARRKLDFLTDRINECVVGVKEGTITEEMRKSLKVGQNTADNIRRPHQRFRKYVPIKTEDQEVSNPVKDCDEGESEDSSVATARKETTSINRRESIKEEKNEELLVQATP